MSHFSNYGRGPRRSNVGGSTEGPRYARDLDEALSALKGTRGRPTKRRVVKMPEFKTGKDK